MPSEHQNAYDFVRIGEGSRLLCRWDAVEFRRCGRFVIVERSDCLTLLFLTSPTWLRSGMSIFGPFESKGAGVSACCACFGPPSLCGRLAAPNLSSAVADCQAGRMGPGQVPQWRAVPVKELQASPSLEFRGADRGYRGLMTFRADSTIAFPGASRRLYRGIADQPQERNLIILSTLILFSRSLLVALAEGCGVTIADRPLQEVSGSVRLPKISLCLCFHLGFHAQALSFPPNAREPTQYA